MFQFIYFQVLNSFVVFCLLIGASQFGRFLRRYLNSRPSRPYYEIETLVGSPKISENQKPDQKWWYLVKLPIKFDFQKLLLHQNLCFEISGGILWGSFLIRLPYMMISAKNSLLVENCQIATQLFRSHIICTFGIKTDSHKPLFVWPGQIYFRFHFRSIADWMDL